MKTITFYSYKGGVGRTLALANIAKRLAEFGKKVCLIDFDLEAPGLHHKFKDNIGHNGIKHGIVDYISCFNNNGKLPNKLTDYVTPINFKNKNYKNIDFIAAGNVYSDKYWNTLFSIDWIKLFYKKESKGVALFVDLKERIKKELKPDYLLIDSRTGISEISGITMSLMADEIVLLAAKNDENIQGIKRIILSLSQPENTLSGILPKLNFVLCRIPYFEKPDEKIIEQRAINEFERDLKEFIKQSEISLVLNKIFVIHSNPTLEIEEKLLMGYQYEKEEENNQAFQRKSIAKSPIASDYLELFEELTKDKLSNREILTFNNIKKAEYFIAMARKLYDNTKKIELLNNAALLNPNSNEAYSELAKCYFYLKEYTKAMENIEKAIKINPYEIDSYNIKGSVYFILKKYNEAENIFIKVLETDQKNFISNSRLGSIKVLKKEYDKALEYYNNLIKYYPYDSRGYNNIGNVYRLKKNWNKAFEYIYKALELSPRDAISTLTLSEIYAELKNLNEFYKNFELALSFGISEEFLDNAFRMDDLYKQFFNDQRFINILNNYNLNFDFLSYK